MGIAKVAGLSITGMRYILFYTSFLASMFMIFVPYSLFCRKWANVLFPSKMRPLFRIASLLLKGPLPFERWAYPTFTVITVAVAPRTFGRIY